MERIGMKCFKTIFMASVVGIGTTCWASDDLTKPKIVRFPSGDLTLGGELYLPSGNGPFPVVLYNHGSASGMKNSMASAAIGPEFAEAGWAFFMPYRRGQGLSEDQGRYIMDEINSVRWNPFKSRAKKLVELQRGDHLDDQMAALAWLKQQPFVDSSRIATAGNSFGGIQVMLGMEKAGYCAGVNAAGAAQSWQDSEDLQVLLKNAAIEARSPVFFYQAENDYDLTPSKALYAVMKTTETAAELKIYPPYGSSKMDGHSFPFRGVSIWFSDVLQFLTEQCAGQMLNKSHHGETPGVERH